MYIIWVGLILEIETYNSAWNLRDINPIQMIASLELPVLAKIMMNAPTNCTIAHKVCDF